MSQTSIAMSRTHCQPERSGSATNKDLGKLCISAFWSCWVGFAAWAEPVCPWNPPPLKRAIDNVQNACRGYQAFVGIVIVVTGDRATTDRPLNTEVRIEVIEVTCPSTCSVPAPRDCLTHVLNIDKLDCHNFFSNSSVGLVV